MHRMQSTGVTVSTKAKLQLLLICTLNCFSSDGFAFNDIHQYPVMIEAVEVGMKPFIAGSQK